MDMDPIVLINNNKLQDIREMIATKKRKSIEIFLKETTAKVAKVMPSGRKRQENAKNFKWLSQIIVKNVNSTKRSFYFCDKNKRFM